MVYKRHRPRGIFPGCDKSLPCGYTGEALQRILSSIPGKTNFSLLYSPAQPIWVSRPGVTFAVPAEAGKDIVAWHAYPALRGGETYQLDAILSNPNRQQLQEAGTDYPEWVTAKISATAKRLLAAYPGTRKRDHRRRPDTVRKSHCDHPLLA